VRLSTSTYPHRTQTIDNSPISLTVDILATLGAGENPLATHAEQASGSTPVANRVPPLAHRGDSYKQQIFYFFRVQRAVSL